MNKKRLLAAIGAVVLITLTVAVPLTTRTICANETVLDPRPESWAQPIEIEGVPNLYKLSDDLYRSAQPSAEGMANLEEMGIKTIINLRSFNSDRDEIEGTDLGYEHIYMKAWHAEEVDAVEFLQIVSDPDRVPVLVHCNLGSDRTGTMCAVYRVAVQGWSKEEAVTEMTQGGFGFNEVWANLPMWVRTSEIDGMMTQAGISQSTQQESLGDLSSALAGRSSHPTPQELEAHCLVNERRWSYTGNIDDYHCRRVGRDVHPSSYPS
jgi:protein tyrosine phosphatase (PTP) superfamily phosphohydrolase (DUF442 family)